MANTRLPIRTTCTDDWASRRRLLRMLTSWLPSPRTLAGEARFNNRNAMYSPPRIAASVMTVLNREPDDDRSADGGRDSSSRRIGVRSAIAAVLMGVGVPSASPIVADASCRRESFRFGTWPSAAVAASRASQNTNTPTEHAEQPRRGARRSAANRQPDTSRLPCSRTDRADRLSSRSGSGGCIRRIGRLGQSGLVGVQRSGCSGGSEGRSSALEAGNDRPAKWGRLKPVLQHYCGCCCRGAFRYVSSIVLSTTQRKPL